MAIQVKRNVSFFGVTCTYCGVQLAYNLNDVVNDGEYAPHIVCPCGTKIQHYGDANAVYCSEDAEEKR